MPRSVRFLLFLLAGLALLSAAATLSVQDTLRRWFTKDLNLRAQLVFSGVRHTLREQWRQPEELRAVLAELCRDERLLAAAVCDSSAGVIAQSDSYPRDLGCSPDADRASRGAIHLSSFPVQRDGQTLGSFHLVHDLAFVERRMGLARRFLLLCFGVLAALASSFTIFLARVTWREWIAQLRRVLRGDLQSQDFLPLLHEVRELADQIGRASCRERVSSPV